MKKMIIAVACLLVARPLLSQTEARLGPLKGWLEQQLATTDLVPLVRPFTQSLKPVTDAKGTWYQLDLSAKTLSQTADAQWPAIELEVPMPDGQTARLQVARANLLTNDFSVLASTGAQTWETPWEPALHYRGLVLDPQAEGVAALTLSDHSVRAVFEWQGRTWNLGPVGNNPLSGKYALYAADKVDLPLSFICESSEPIGPKDEVHDSGIQYRSPGENCVRVRAEVNYGLFTRLNSSVKETADYVAFLYNVVSTIYYLEQIRTMLSQIQIWTVPDPYPSTSSTDAIRAFGGTIQNATGGDLAHLLANYPDSVGNGLGGWAWIGVLCDTFNPVDSSGPYAFSNVIGAFEELPTYSWDVNVVAHEMGHNLGAPHTHDCFWNDDATQIDDCGNLWLITNGKDDDDDGTVDNVEEANACFDSTNIILPTAGTIMSYCHLINGTGIDLTLGFGDQPGDLIRNAVANAACLGSCDSLCLATLHLFDPITEPADFEADQYIIAQNEVALDSGVVDYDAGQYVVLKPGFHATVDSGALFHAFIDGCGNLRPAMQGPPPVELDTGVEMASAVRLRAEPNPADHVFQLEIEVQKTDTPIGLYLADRFGQVVRPIREPTFWPAGTHTLYVETGDLPAGVYFLVCTSGHGRNAMPIVVVH